VRSELRALGADVHEDGAAATLPAGCGNIVGRFPPTAEGGVPIMFGTHLDTVPVTGPIEVELVEGHLANRHDAILGGDNKSAVAAMLEATRRIVGEGLPHAGIELLFTPKEEVGLLGAYAFDATRLEAQIGYVYDQAAPIGEIILGAPSAKAIEARFHGRAAHAGMAPEEGRSAIAAAARALADLRLGRVDAASTANVGRITGGTARNIVPEWCVLTAEARSHDDAKLAALVQEMLDAFGFAASLCDCTVETEVRAQYRAYRFREDDQAVRLAKEALRRTGHEPTTALSGGAADANVFNERGLPCVNLANGMADIHTPDEHIAAADLETMVDVTLALVDAARR
jgi:tripeptide aminopeptidase